MGVVDRVQESWYRATGRSELAEAVRAERDTVALLTETIADLERRMSEPGWQRLTAQADQEFTREGLGQISAVCRVMALKSPLIKRGLGLRAGYVWGQGVSITARANGQQDGQQDVNDVIQKFLSDPGNLRTFTGPAARETLERALGTDGNVFVACFTKPLTGSVQVRVLPWDEITDVITNPEDASEPWFYRREWWADEPAPGELGTITRRRTMLYPALGHRPAYRPPAVGDRHGEPVPVAWDAPVYHLKVGGLQGWTWGLGDAYAAVDWARAYTEFLTDWARLVKSLSRFAWKLTTPGRKQAQARARLASGPSRDTDGDANHAGASALLAPDMTLEAIPKSGATIDSESGRPVAAMIAAALDLPVTMLLGDPGVTGARATAETLDPPTERSMQARRAVHTEALQAILAHVIAAAVEAEQGPLNGRITRDEWGRQVVELDGDTEPTIDISWPDLDDVDITTVVAAVTDADSTGYLPPLVVARLLLEALGVTDVDSILEQLTDEDGEFKRPEGAGGGGAGRAALDAFRRGEDPAALLGDPDDPDEPDRQGDEPSDDSDAAGKNRAQDGAQAGGRGRHAARRRRR